MNELPRWRIDELQTRYELEPLLADYFVEGRYDCEILSILTTESSDPPSFYEIDVVDVPDTLLKKHGLTSGNKQRVIALAKEFDASLPKSKVSCLVDRDLDQWFDDLIPSAHLRWTMYASLECHFIQQELVTEIMLTVAKVRVDDMEEYYSSLLNVLRELFALRLADRELLLCLKWIPLSKYIRCHGDRIEMEIDKYTKAVLEKNKLVKRKEEFIARSQHWRKKLDCDIRSCARGHDFTEILAWTIKKYRGVSALASEHVIKRILLLKVPHIPTLRSELQSSL